MELYIFDGDAYIATEWVREADEESAKQRYETAGYRAILASELIANGVPLPRFRRLDYVTRRTEGRP